jgi:hypothetical protein
MLWRVANSETGPAILGQKFALLAGTDCLRMGFGASGGYERKLTTVVAP